MRTADLIDPEHHSGVNFLSVDLDFSAGLHILIIVG